MDNINFLQNPHCLNEDPISFDNELLYFYQSQYQDGTTMIYSKTENGFLYDYVSICVTDHVGSGLEYNDIVLNHNLTHEFREMFYNNFCYNYEEEYCNCKEVQYGFSFSNLVKISPSFLIKTYNGNIKGI